MRSINAHVEWSRRILIGGRDRSHPLSVSTCGGWVDLRIAAPRPA